MLVEIESILPRGRVGESIGVATMVRVLVSDGSSFSTRCDIAVDVDQRISSCR